MGIYPIYCNRCSRRTTHRTNHSFDELPEYAIKEHPKFDKTVACDECVAGRSKANVPEDGLTVDVSVTLKPRLEGVEINPNEIKDEESIYEYVSRLIGEQYMDRLLSSLSPEDITGSFIKLDNKNWPNPEDG